MVGSELGWWETTAAAVWSDLVVVPTLVGDDLPCLGQRREPVFVEALVAELTVEALDISVLRGGTRFEQDVFDAVSLRSGNESAAGELRTVVGAHGSWVAAEACRLVEQVHP